MSILNNSVKRVVKEFHDHDDESDILENIYRSSEEGDATSAGANNMEAEKRIRREIANSNERRRMQSINAGFQSLRTLLPHHEGEKLSKAAILQQTAEYIYNLEQEKTRLLSQNCQLMRQVHQHEGGDMPPKKRKAEILLPTVQAVSAESSDEGLGSMSPEPVGIVAVVNSSIQATSTSTNPEIIELRRQLERERNIRIHLEEQIRNFENQMYQQIQYQHQEVIEHDAIHEAIHEGIHEGIHEVREGICEVREVMREGIRDGMREGIREGIRETLVTVIQENEDLEMQLVTADNLPPVGQTQTVVCSPQLSRSPSPTIRSSSPTPTEPSRLPSVLEAAIKAEPKVEVERLPSPTPHDDVNCSRIYVNTSRQNLETIVEAIRHLEGDHLFGDEPPVKQITIPQISIPLPQQEVPLALTNKPTERIIPLAPERLLKVEMNPYLQFHPSTVQQQQQSRPGVIVVKQHS